MRIVSRDLFELRYVFQRIASLVFPQCGFDGRFWRQGFLVALAVVATTGSPSLAAEPISRVLPPVGIEIPATVRESLESQLATLQRRMDDLRDQTDRADVEIYWKAVDYALRHSEFYSAKDFEKATSALKQAAARLDALETQQAAWKRQRGLLVRGYRSRIDDSAQPYGLVIPEDVDLTKPLPLYVWLHGRGDKQTDLYFIHERERSIGQIAPRDAIVLHPFGRHCLGFKSAGEIDVLEAIQHVRDEYPIDLNRIVLIGFSMGGAGAWHLGAHYADRWCVVSPGAGFAETAAYNKLSPDKYPPSYEQRLWGCYDVPNYVRNLFNLPVFAYSGENDKQIQAARVMEAAYQQEGRSLRHLIGPRVEHKYEPETLKELLALVRAEVEKGRTRAPRKVSWQSRTLRYAKLFWLEALGLEQHWEDARIDAELSDDGQLSVATRNVTALRMTPPGAVRSVRIDEQSLPVSGQGAELTIELVRAGGVWKRVDDSLANAGLAKRPGLQGPIDDAFLEPFLVVLPSRNASSRAVATWVETEAGHFRDRWRALCRGELRVKQDHEVTDADVERFHLVLWGDAASNRWIERIQDRLPIQWKDGQVNVGEQSFASDRHVPAMIYPNPLNSKRYVVLNSGLTFREAHDRTNSQQNPKLPDWAIIDITQPANSETPGRIVAADFFDERWQPLKR